MQKSEKKIAVVGSNMVDFIVKIKRPAKVGESLFANSFTLGFGGKGTNQAIAASKLGAKVLMVSKVGDDLFGASVKDNMKDYGLDVKFVETAKGFSSGVASIYVDEQATNTMQVVKGANEQLLPKDIDNIQEELKKCDIIILQLEIPFATVAHTIKFANKHKIPVIFNPAPTPDIKLDFEVVKLVDYLVPNENELAGISGMTIKSVEDARVAGKKLLSEGLKNIIVTLGEKGSLLLTEKHEELIEPYKVDSVDTTGAGDAFIGSFACFLLELNDPLAAMRLANKYAAISTTKIGAQKSYLDRKEFFQAIE